jgi:predicted DNA-binding transcriptional regulator AlpA
MAFVLSLAALYKASETALCAQTLEVEMAIIGYEGFCQRYDVKKATAYSLVCRKEIPHIRISGRMVRFDTDVTDAWFAARAVGDCRMDTDGKGEGDVEMLQK